MECQIEENLETCPCTYPPGLDGEAGPGCDKKGKCCECLKYHLASNELPACCFSKEAEKTYDRSFKKFVEDKGL